MKLKKEQFLFIYEVRVLSAMCNETVCASSLKHILNRQRYTTIPKNKEKE
jgi:hypothetical protein